MAIQDLAGGMRAFVTPVRGGIQVYLWNSIAIGSSNISHYSYSDFMQLSAYHIFHTGAYKYYRYIFVLWYLIYACMHQCEVVIYCHFTWDGIPKDQHAHAAGYTCI